MARNRLPLESYEACQVLMPGEDGVTEIEAVRVVVFAPNFPQRALAPELLVGAEQAERVTIAHDQKSIRGYLRRSPPEGAQIRVRYGDSLEGVVDARFSRRHLRPISRDCGG